MEAKLIINNVKINIKGDSMDVINIINLLESGMKKKNKSDIKRLNSNKDCNRR